MPRYILKQEYNLTEWYLVYADSEEDAIAQYNKGEVDRDFPYAEECEPCENTPVVIEGILD